MRRSCLQINEHRCLANLCTFGIGGPARFFAEVENADQMAEAFLFARENDLRTFVLGKGSNCLFDDRGFNGLVILNRIDFLQIEGSDLAHNRSQIENLECAKAKSATGCGRFTAGAGYSFSRLGSYTARNGWSGLEFASGIPGSVGGAVYMNAGANGQETATALASVDFLSFEGELTSFDACELSFGYRSSPFQALAGAIISATFALKRHSDAKQQQRQIIEYRKATQPYGMASAGCFFSNPDGSSAGQLVDSCGLKGLTVGGAQVSPIHANFIVNTGAATARDILELSSIVKQRVKETSGHDLEQEVRFVPFV